MKENLSDWLNKEFCQVLVDNCGEEETVADACDLCPFSSRCYKDHNGLKDWLIESGFVK